MSPIHPTACLAARRRAIQAVTSMLVVLSLAAVVGPVLPVQAGTAVDFGAALNYGTGRSPAGLTLADFNGDGKPDVAAANRGDDSISILIGNGDGTLAAKTDFAVGNDPEGLAAGDFNRDGRVDLGVANYGGNSLSVLIGNGDGSFAAKVDYAADSGPMAVAAGDFNLDGRLDLATVNYLSNQADIFLGNGDGTFAAKVAYGAGTYPAGLLVRDFNRDGKPDLLVANYNSNKLSLLAGNGDGTFAAKVEFATGSTPMGVAAGDFNRDGKLDVATPNRYGNSASVLGGNGDGTFAAKTDYALAGNPYAIVAADFDRDGALDLATANYAANSLSVLAGQGNGTFGSKVELAAGTNPESVAAGDLNLDGKPDLVAVNFGSNNLSVLLNNTATAASQILAKVDSAVGNKPYAVAAGDFNRDGNLDLVNANYTAGTVSLLAGNGDGTFAGKADYTVASNPAAVAVADFNLDGKLDLVTANFVANSVSILAGVGDGTFLARVDAAAGSAATAVAAGDFNRDGKPDVATANRNANTISILTGNGNGTLNAKVDYAAGTQPVAVGTGDFDRDGILDLVVANYSVDTLGLFTGNGDGTFDAMTTFGVGDTPSAFAIGDLNLDGKLDLVCANRGTSNVSVLIGKGDGTLNTHVTYSVGIWPMSIALADLNLDGRLDIIAGNNSDSDVSVLMGTGGGIFGGRVDYATGTNPRSVLASDFDHDGRPDIATANNNSNNVSILRQEILAANLRLHKTVTPSAAAPGATVMYTLVFSNSGVITATGIVLSDRIPISVTNPNVVSGGAVITAVAGSSYTWQVQNLAPGQGGAITITGVLSQTLPGGAVITNPALITGTTPETTMTDNSSAAALVVSNSAPIISLASSVNPSRFGEAVTFTATVAAAGPGSPPPTGSVTFAYGGTQLGSAPVGTGGAAVLATASLPRGSHSVTAQYSGDGTFSSAFTTPYQQAVEKAATTTAVEAAPNPAVYGDDLLLSATVVAASPGSGLPTGLMTFKDGDTTVGTGAVDGAGHATLMLADLMPGSHTIVAQYGGDNNFLPSTAEPLEAQIKQLPTATTLEIAPNPAILGQPVAFTATVTALAQDSQLHTTSAPSGDITFMAGGTTLAAFPLDGNGRAVYATADLGEGIYEVTAEYAGNGYFGTSLSDPEGLLVQRLPIALNDAAGTLEDTPVLIDVLANDVDATVGAMSITQVAQAGHGRIDVADNGKSLTYTPAAGFTGVDSFGYSVIGVEGGTDAAMVTVVVSARGETNQAPRVAPINLRAAGTQQFVTPQAVITAQIPAGIYGGAIGPKDLFFVSYTAVITPSAHAASPPPGLHFGRFSFLLGAYVNNVPLPDLQFAGPMTLTAAYGAGLAGATATGSAGVYRWDGTGWSTTGIVALESNAAGHVVCFSTLRPGEFALFISPDPVTGSSLWMPLLARQGATGAAAAESDGQAGASPGWSTAARQLFLPWAGR